MASYVRSYILCPDFNHPPESVVLGHIIATPSTPWITLNGEDLIAPEDSSVHQVIDRNWKSVWTEGGAGSSDAFDVFLRLLGLNDGSTTTSQVRITADVVETTTFEPHREYFGKCLESQGVQRFLVASKFKKPMFLVTGTMVAKGANFSKSKKSSFESSKAFPEDSLTVGIGSRFQSSLVDTKPSAITFDATSDFVFAYRLKKVTYRQGRPLIKAGDLLGDLKYSTTQFEVGEEDGGAEDINDVVAETVKDTEKSNFTSQVLYSAKDYNKGAVL